MPDWREVLTEIKNEQIKAEADVQSALKRGAESFDTIRRKYLKSLYEHTGRNVIAYYSGWQSKNVAGTEIRDEDKNGFMMAIHGLNRDLGLDLILHTPGGSISATHSIVTYLKEKLAHHHLS